MTSRTENANANIIALAHTSGAAIRQIDGDTWSWDYPGLAGGCGLPTGVDAAFDAIEAIFKMPGAKVIGVRKVRQIDRYFDLIERRAMVEVREDGALLFTVPKDSPLTPEEAIAIFRAGEQSGRNRLLAEQAMTAAMCRRD